jgi:hypothetical protein
VNGGLATLGRINPDVQKAVMNAGVPIADIRGKNKAWFGESSTDTLWDYSIEKLIRDAGGDAEEQLIVDGQVQWFGVMRGALQEALAETLPKDEKIKLQFGKELVGISSRGENGAYCEFSDGTTDGNFDLVVGCDGVKSAVKEYIEKGKISPDPSKREGNAAAIYSGIRIAYAVQDGDLSEGIKDKLAVQQTFADGAYIFSGTFGNGPNRAPCNCNFIISLDEDYNGPFGKRKTVPREAEAAAENTDWSQDVKRTKDEARKKMLGQLATAHIDDEKIISTVSILVCWLDKRHPIVRGKLRCALWRCCARNAPFPWPRCQSKYSRCVLSGSEDSRVQFAVRYGARARSETASERIRSCEMESNDKHHS